MDKELQNGLRPVCVQTRTGIAAGYVRVSQERAARNGYGLGAQESDIRKHVDYKGWKLVEVYQENGVSGYKKDRPALERLLKDAENGRFDVVIFPSIDRVGRSVKDVIEIDGFLRKHKVDTVFLREGVDTSTPTGALYRNIMSSVAEFEGRLIYERLSKGKREKAAEGGYIGGWLPYGYAKDEDNVVVVKKEAGIVEQIFHWRASGKSLQWICNHLNSAKIKTKRNGTWRVSTIRGVLKNRFYTGRRALNRSFKAGSGSGIEFEGTFVRAQHDAIISDMLFSKCNQ